MKLHIEMVHIKLRWPCDQCGKEFNSQPTLKRHTENVHKGIRYSCPHCDKIFTAKPSLKCHIDAVHRSIKHYCSICNQSFSQVGDMRIHVKAVHNGVKSKCEICSKEFNRAPEMRRHMRAVHKVAVPLKEKEQNRALQQPNSQKLQDPIQALAQGQLPEQRQFSETWSSTSPPPTNFPWSVSLEMVKCAFTWRLFTMVSNLNAKSAPRSSIGQLICVDIWEPFTKLLSP